jgi:NADH:ubiquinone oxidoreductase subunit 3 (subunit A)
MEILLKPGITFFIVLAAVVALYMAMRLLSAGRRGAKARGLGPYSCGEELPSHTIQPDYSQFYPFAFFFTILHVVALMACTIPAPSLTSGIIAALYVVGAVVGLVILYRK